MSLLLLSSKSSNYLIEKTNEVTTMHQRNIWPLKDLVYYCFKKRFSLLYSKKVGGPKSLLCHYYGFIFVNKRKTCHSYCVLFS